MGLMIHSLGELPPEAERGYFVYLLDYGWNEPLGEVVTRNFTRMAEEASRHNAVVLQGLVGAHFEDEVLSWHHINGQPGEEILPAILITTRNPHEFRERHFRDGQNLAAENRMLLIPLRLACKTSSDVAQLIDRIFADIRARKEISNFEIARELRRGKSGALSDAIILRPSFSGIGIDLKFIFDFFRGRLK